MGSRITIVGIGIALLGFAMLVWGGPTRVAGLDEVLGAGRDKVVNFQILFLAQSLIVFGSAVMVCGFVRSGAKREVLISAVTTASDEVEQPYVESNAGAFAERDTQAISEDDLEEALGRVEAMAKLGNPDAAHELMRRLRPGVN